MIIGERKHTFPSRTRSLSSQPPMVVRPRCRARVGCCQSNEPRCPKGCRGSLCMRMPARTTAGVYANKGCFGKLLTHFVKLRFTSFNFNSLFLKLLLCSELQFIASLMSPDVRTQKFLRYAQKAFGKHNWREPITRRARTARIGVSQPKQTRAKDVGALFVCGCPLARQRGLSAVVQLYPPTR